MSSEEIEKEEAESERGSRWQGFAAAAALVLVMFLAFVANHWKSGLTIGEVRVEGTRILTDDEIVGLAGIGEKQRLVDVDLYQVQKRLRKNYFIKTASVCREAPGRIVITVVERQPVAAVALGKVHFLDQEGYVLPPLVSVGIGDIPVITGDVSSEDLVPGRRVQSAGLREALLVVEALRALGDVVDRRISEVHVGRNQEIMLVTVEGSIPVYCGQGNHGKKLVMLMAFWNQVAIRQDASRLEYIDLRYDGQVVTKWKDSRTVKGRPENRSIGNLKAQGLPSSSTTVGERFIHTQRKHHG